MLIERCLACGSASAAAAAFCDPNAALQQVKQLRFAPDHARSYNELVEVIERNLLLADWQDEDHLESLLSERQAKWAREMVRNIRYAAPMVQYRTSHLGPSTPAACYISWIPAKPGFLSAIDIKPRKPDSPVRKSICEL